MEEEVPVFEDDWISDDSSFYGDSEEQERLLSLDNEFNFMALWKARTKDLNALTAWTRSAAPPSLFNPREGYPDSWQIGETPDDFIVRLPPLTTSRASCEWIWVANPHLHTGKSPSQDVAELKSRGSQLLQQSRQKRCELQMGSASSPTGTCTRELNQESKMLQEKLQDLALKTNVVTGKWMLFPKLEDVTRIWSLVVEGVLSNRLGPTAKVAPDEGKPDARLICVYTKDFRDQQDVLRVLKELVSMGLVGVGRPIYYKSDLYTWLDIYSSNAAEYGLQASLYSSQKMLAEASRPKSKAVPQKKQSTLNGLYQSTNKKNMD